MIGWIARRRRDIFCRRGRCGRGTTMKALLLSAGASWTIRAGGGRDSALAAARRLPGPRGAPAVYVDAGAAAGAVRGGARGAQRSDGIRRLLANDTRRD